MISRRPFLEGIAVAIVAAPLVAVAVQAEKLWRIGFLGLPSASSYTGRINAFRRGLRELGYVEGRTLAIEFRWAEGDADHLPALAAELAALKLDVIVTSGREATVAAHRATSTIPIVFAVMSYPLDSDFVHSLARPGSNVTGFTDMTEDVGGKRLQVLQEALPRLTRIAAFWNPANVDSRRHLRDIEAAGRTLGLSVRSIEIRNANQVADAFATALRAKAGAIVVVPDAELFAQRDQIAQLAVKNRLPSLAWTRDLAESGCLMIYGPNVVELHERAATYVDKILKGAKPADLPVEQPTKFELVINLKTAKALGLTIPPSLLLRADEVIQ